LRPRATSTRPRSTGCLPDARRERQPDLLLASGADPFSTNWAGAITLRIPVFRGFDTAYQVQKAREEAESARATAERTEDQVILDVWTGYYAVQTASQRVKTSRDLLASATQTVEVRRAATSPESARSSIS
jgi:outer membrane protein TolC